MLSIADELSHHSSCASPAYTWMVLRRPGRVPARRTRTVSFNAAIVPHATHQAAALSAARTVTTSAQRAALPHGTILVDPADDSGYLVDGVGWEYVARRLEEHPRPLVVVWHP